ncbi:hypothetical protein HWV62_9275 [Athelia sp. TMB]|nr:hypothetical protein HWV62_9275 [Athelia sp. TMB]
MPGVQLIRLQNAVVDSVGGTYSVRAHFGSWAQTRDVYNQCNKRRFPFIGNSAFLWLRLPDPIEYNITIPISQYRAQEKEWDALVKSIKDEDGRKLTIVPRDRVSVIRVGGEDKKAVGALKVHVESIAAGEKVDGWHSSLSQRFADRVLRDTGAFLRIDRRLRALKVFGEPGSIAAARVIVDTELAHMESLEQIVLLKRESIRFFVTRGLAMLKAELGEDNAALDVSSVPPKVVIRGGEAARHTLNRLISESLDTANTACGDVGEATCPICSDAITLPIKLGCGHAYCSACIRHFLASASSFPLVCIGDEDKCHIPIPIPVIQRFLPVQQYTNLLEQAFITYVDHHPEDLKYCTTADCRQIYRCDKSKRGTIVHCPACLSSVCAACHEEGHEGMTCAERKLQNDPEEQERLNEQLARESGFKRCPRCSVWIEKTEGCNHMECRCGAHLCWVCMEVFDAQSVYPHMSSAHGGFHDVNARQVNQLYQQDYFAEQQEALHLAALRDQEALRQAAARREQREDVRVRHAQRAGEDVMRRQRRHEFGHIYEYTTPEEALREHEILRLQQARRRHEIREEALRQEEGGPGSFFGGLVQVLAFMGYRKLPYLIPQFTLSAPHVEEFERVRHQFGLAPMGTNAGEESKLHKLSTFTAGKLRVENIQPFEIVYTSKLTQTAKTSRRTTQKSLLEEDVATKRARGKISCAECKRLKLKCDKHPSRSLYPRNCPAALASVEDAPPSVHRAVLRLVKDHGVLHTGFRLDARLKECRFILTDTDSLLQKIGEMGQRIRQLEDALAKFQSGVSEVTHPLLRDELLSIKFGPESRQPEESQSLEESTDDPLADAIDAFGTLSIGESGESSYFGRSGGSEGELDVNIGSSESIIAPGRAMPEFINVLAAMFPMDLGSATDPQNFAKGHDMLLSHLPSTPRAWSLLEAYMENASWVFQPLRREHLIADILTPIYNAKKERESTVPGKEWTMISPHKFAVLFLIFALGANMDFTLPLNNAEEAEYHHYACAAIALRSVFDTPTMETVQALLLMAHYRHSAGERYTRDSSWALVGLACKLAQAMGLHRDPERWNMDDKTANCRRRLFWELYFMDLIVVSLDNGQMNSSPDISQGLTLGRPPCIDLAYVDCAFPSDRSEADNQFWSWKYNFAKNVFDSVIKLTLAAKPPSYKSILELDRKVRESVLPETLNITRPENDDQSGAHHYMQGGQLAKYRTITMLFLHKSFFAQALLEHPENPLLSRYAPSFLATTSCASAIVKNATVHYSKFPQLCLRIFEVILGSIATRAPSCPEAHSAFLEMGIAVDLFTKAVENSLPARKAMEILVQMKEKASAIYNQFRSGARSSDVATNPQMLYEQGGVVDELAIFGGQTRILFSKNVLSKAPNANAASTVMRANATSPQSTSSPNSETAPDSALSTASHPPIEQEDTEMQNVHPSLMAYMSMLSSTATPCDFAGYSDEAFSLTPNQPNTSRSEEFSPFTAPPDFFHLQVPDYLMQQGQTQTPLMTSSYDPNLFGPFGQFYQEASTHPNAPSLPMWQTADLGASLGARDVVDERWMAFVHENAASPTSLDAFNAM